MCSEPCLHQKAAQGLQYQVGSPPSACDATLALGQTADALADAVWTPLQFPPLSPGASYTLTSFLSYLNIENDSTPFDGPGLSLRLYDSDPTTGLPAGPPLTNAETPIELIGEFRCSINVTAVLRIDSAPRQIFPDRLYWVFMYINGSVILPAECPSPSGRPPIYLYSGANDPEMVARAPMFTRQVQCSVGVNGVVTVGAESDMRVVENSRSF